MSSVIVTQVVEQLQTLPDNLQREVLEFVHTLRSSAVIGTPGKQLLQFAGTISADDLDLMSQAIEADCEQIDPNEW